MVLGIYGSGGSGCELCEIAERQKSWRKIVFIDDMMGNDIYRGIERISFEQFCHKYETEEARVIIAQGEPANKVKLYDKVQEKGFSFANLIHPMSWVSPSAEVGQGVVIQAYAFISCDTKIEDNVHILQGSNIAHNCIVHKHCQISSHVVIGGYVEIGEKTYIGINASVKDRIKVGSNVVIGMGATVIRDIPSKIIVGGNPARKIKSNVGDMIFKNTMPNLDQQKF